MAFYNGDSWWAVFNIFICLALTKHIYKKIKSKYLNKPDLGHIITPIKRTYKENT